MNAESTTTRQGVATNALAIFSVATFWAIPFAPLIAMAALHRTKSTTGWARRLSVAAAVLCSVHTLALAAALYCITILLLTGRIHS
jgi:Na+/H+-dicarboxylate symporter